MLDRDDVIAIVEQLQFSDSIKTAELQHMIGISYTKAIRVLMDLSDMGLVQRADKPGLWKVEKEKVRKYLLLNVAN